MRECVLRDAGGSGSPYGHGLVVVYGARLDVAGSFVRKNAGIGLLFAAGSGAVDDTQVVANHIGVHAQDGSVLREVKSFPTALDPLAVYVTKSSRFVDNDARVGTGQVPLPEPLPP
jgi:hypothetical protein